MATDVIMYVGEQYYSLAQYIDETEQLGVHKRIPLNSVPDGMVAGESRIFLAHKKAIVRPSSIGLFPVFATSLFEAGLLPRKEYEYIMDNPEIMLVSDMLHPEQFVPAGMLSVSIAFSRADKETQDKLIKEYGLEFLPGVFGYAYIASLHFILGSGEEELPAELAHMSDIIEPVHVKIIE